MATELTAQLSADSSGTSQSVEQLRSKLEALNAMLAETKQKIKDTSDEFKRLTKRKEELSAAMKDGATEKQKEEMKALQDSTAQLTSDFTKFLATEKELQNEVDSTNKQLDQQKEHTDNLKNALSDIGNSIKNFVTSNGTKKLWEMLIGSNAEMEQYQTSLEIMLGDVDRAKTVMEDMRKFALDTPFALDDVFSNGKMLMNYGVEPDELIDTMTKLGDLSGGNAEQLNLVTQAYSKMLENGKVSSDELRQLTEAGIPLQNALSEAIGVTGEKLSEMVSNGKVGIDDLNNAIVNLTTGDGLFAGAMEKQSQTMNGMLSSIQEKLNEFMRQLGEGAFGEVKDVLAEFENQLKQWEEDGTLERWAKSLGTTISEFINLLRGAIEIIFEFKDQLIAVFAGRAVYGVVSNFLPACKKVVQGLKDISTNAKTSAAALNVYALALAAIVTAGISVYQSLQAANEIVNEYRSAMENLKKTGEEDINRTKAELSVLKEKSERYDELRTAAELTAEEEAELKSIADELQDVLGDSVTVIDEKTKAYNDLSQAVEDYIDTQIRAAEKEAAYNMLVEAQAQSIKADQELKQLTDGREKLFEAYGTGFDNEVFRDINAVVNNANKYNPFSWAGTLLNDSIRGVTVDELIQYGELKVVKDEADKLAEGFAETCGDLERAIYSAGDTTEETSKQFKSFADIAKELTEETEDYYDVAKEAGEITKKLSDAAAENRNNIKNLANEYSRIASVVEEYHENGELSLSTALDIIDSGYAAALAIDAETGAVRLNVEAYQNLAKAKLEAQKASVAFERQELEERKAALVNEVQALSRVNATELPDALAELASITKRLEELNNSKNAINAIYDSMISDTDHWENPDYKNPYSNSGSSGGGSDDSDIYKSAYNAYKTEADKKLELIKRELEAKRELRDETIAAIDAEIEARKRLNEDNNLEDEINEVKAQLKYSRLDDFSRDQLEKRLSDLYDEKSELNWQRQMADRKAAANEEYALYEEQAKAAQDKINESINTYKAIIEAIGSGAAAMTVINNNNSTRNNTANINLAQQGLTMAQITKAVKNALMDDIII